MASTRNALVFDIETVADLTPDNRDAVAALAAHREQMSPEHYGALCPPLARVVCIAWLALDSEQMGVLADATLCPHSMPESVSVTDGRPQSAGLRPWPLQPCDGERDLLRTFGTLLERHCQQPNAQLATFNGRGFDLPVLVHRGIRHGVSEGRSLLLRAAREARFNPVLHLDLMEAVTFGGASPRWPLAAYAIGYGYASPKHDMEGSQVGAAVQAGRIVEVARYCAGDVIATAHIYRALPRTMTAGGNPR
jgi:hypothetical protein